VTGDDHAERREHAESPYRGDSAWYWERRHDLFDRFDDGVCYDEEGLYSIKPMVVAQEIASKMPGDSVVDAFGGLGGTSVAFARMGKNVETIEILRTRAAMLRGNLMLYQVMDRVRVHEGDAFQMAPQMHADALYLDPPWGGPAILRRQMVGFELFPAELPSFIQEMRQAFGTVAISLPPNFDRRQFSGELKPCEVIPGSLWGRVVVLTAFFGRTA
jgi:trimethylguanosine synthase